MLVEPVKTVKLPLMAIEEEAERILTICNACRYCEGHCAVFPALERRRTYSQADMDFLAHLCHQCGACYAHCQYAEPHEFQVNLPSTLSQIRIESFERYTKPALLRIRFLQGPVAALLLILLATGLFMFLAGWQSGAAVLLDAPGASFYNVLPHAVMVRVFGFAGIVVLVSWIWSLALYWQRLSLPAPWRIPAIVWRSALVSALTLKNLDGGHGRGCYEQGEVPSTWRRGWHHLVMTGFMLCFAATVSGTFKHYVLDLPAPYGWISVPKMLGVTGGIILVVGCVGMLINRQKLERALLTPEHQTGGALLLLLLATSLSGLALPVLAETRWLPLVLCLHLGAVLALFVDFACGKFVHGLYRTSALLADALEISQGSPLGSKP